MTDSFSVRAKLNGCLSWHLPVAHVVATTPEEDQSWSAGIITSGSTCGVLRVVLYQRDIQKERDPPAARINYQHAGLGRGNCPSTGSHTNGENALELTLLQGRKGRRACPSGPARVNATKRKVRRPADGVALGVFDLRATGTPLCRTQATNT